MTLSGVYRLARELSILPGEVLDWPEREFYLWLSISRDVEKDDLMLQSIALSFAMWKPQALSKLLDSDREGPMREEEIEEALAKAERITKMPMKETT